MQSLWVTMESGNNGVRYSTPVPIYSCPGLQISILVFLIVSRIFYSLFQDVTGTCMLTFSFIVLKNSLSAENFFFFFLNFLLIHFFHLFRLFLISILVCFSLFSSVCIINRYIAKDIPEDS